MLTKSPTGGHLGLWIGYKVTTLGQHFIRNIHHMFDSIPFSGSLKKVICMHFPKGLMLNQVPRWRQSWMMDWLQSNNTWSALIRNIHAMFGFIPFSGSLEVICMHFP